MPNAVFCGVCAFRVRVWKSSITYRSSGYGYELTKFRLGARTRTRRVFLRRHHCCTPGIVPRAYVTYRSLQINPGYGCECRTAELAEVPVRVIPSESRKYPGYGSVRTLQNECNLGFHFERDALQTDTWYLVTTSSDVAILQSRLRGHFRSHPGVGGLALRVGVRARVILQIKVVRMLWKTDSRVFADKFGWVRFLAVCFLYKTDPNPTKSYLLWGKKVAQMPRLT